jgi:alpha-tubulin suppressor-like RCC1 family protein
LNQANPPAGTFSTVASGAYHSCAVTLQGEVVCWGAGQTYSDAGCPHPVYDCGQAGPPPGGGFVGLALGTAHSCALRDDGRILCWGLNTYGQASPP